MKRILGVVTVLLMFALIATPVEAKHCRRPCRPTLTYGVTYIIDPDVEGWTVPEVRSMLHSVAYQLDVLGPNLTVHLTTTGPTSATVSVGTSGSTYTYFKSTIWLNADSNHFYYPNRNGPWPLNAIAHEYGHSWSLYHYYITQQKNWNPYLEVRGLVGDPRLDTSYAWSIAELIADDYRLLFTPAQYFGYINRDLTDPRGIPGFKDWFIHTWAGLP